MFCACHCYFCLPIFLTALNLLVILYLDGLLWKIINTHILCKGKLVHNFALLLLYVYQCVNIK